MITPAGPLASTATEAVARIDDVAAVHARLDHGFGCVAEYRDDTRFEYRDVVVRESFMVFRRIDLISNLCSTRIARRVAIRVKAFV